MAEEDVKEVSTFSYIWYTAIWYLVQFLVITTLHFFASRQLNKRVVQRAASDTLVLALVFLSLQWSQKFLFKAIYSLPYIIIYMLVDMIPTAIWLCGSQLMLLSSLGLAQKLYYHVSGTKACASAIQSHMSAAYFAAPWKSQAHIEHSINQYIKQQFSKLSQKLEEKVAESPLLAILFTSASLLLKLSTLGFAFTDCFWSTLKRCYEKLRQKKAKDVQTDFYQTGGVMSVTVCAAAWMQYKAVLLTMSMIRQAVYKISPAAGSAMNKSIKRNSETSASSLDNGSDSFGAGDSSSLTKHHDD
ncbi:uncharacterized protein [Watersipora subatra]|uniref:uncharacterized protein n=1 Tax=Watersipora subatra TaxID=2589382 RepID=UPI00355C71E0